MSRLSTLRIRSRTADTEPSGSPVVCATSSMVR
jgi:hypothetical protein